MKIAVIGWGSLIWCPGALAMASRWHNDGPELSVEFARVSGNKRLTLVVVPDAPSQKCYWVLSSLASVEEARENLWVREGRPAKQDIVAWTSAKSEDPIHQAIAKWASGKGMDAAIWTALGPRDNEKKPRVMGEQEAVDYLRGLPQEPGDLAREYICNAPAQIQTPYRKRFRQEFGWEDAQLAATLFE